MGGLIYFVLIIPAGFFLLVAARCAAAIARSGSKIPIVITRLSSLLNCPPFPLDRPRDFE
jgi:hypothetical protein